MSLVGDKWTVPEQRTAGSPVALRSVGEAPVRVAVVGITHVDRDTGHDLRAAARGLAEEFPGTLDLETIEHFLVSRHAELARSASVTTFLPLLAERYVRDRLRILAQ